MQKIMKKNIKKGKIVVYYTVKNLRIFFIVSKL